MTNSWNRDNRIVEHYNCDMLKQDHFDQREIERPSRADRYGQDSYMQNSGKASCRNDAKLRSIRTADSHSRQISGEIVIFIESYKFEQQQAAISIEGLLDRTIKKVVVVSCLSHVRIVEFGTTLSMNPDSWSGPAEQAVERARRGEVDKLTIKLTLFRSQLTKLGIELEIICATGISSCEILIEESHRLRPTWIVFHSSFPIWRLDSLSDWYCFHFPKWTEKSILAQRLERLAALQHKVPSKCSLAMIPNPPATFVHLFSEDYLSAAELPRGSLPTRGDHQEGISRRSNQNEHESQSRLSNGQKLKMEQPAGHQEGRRNQLNGDEQFLSSLQDEQEIETVESDGMHRDFLNSCFQPGPKLRREKLR